jgi:hypothetical protein
MILLHNLAIPSRTYDLINFNLFPQNPVLEIPSQGSYQLYYPSMNPSQLLTYFQLNFDDPIETWLEESFLKKFSKYNNVNIFSVVNKINTNILL